MFLRRGVVSTSPNPPNLEYHPLSAVRDCLFNIFAASLHIDGLSSIRKLRTRHAVETGTLLGDPGVEGKIIFRWIFRKWNMGVWTG